MKSLADLLDRLYFTYSNLEKIALLKEYFANTPDPDRGLAVAIISGTLSFKYYKRALIHEVIEEQIDPVLFALSYDYVGDLSETISLLWSQKTNKEFPPLSKLIPLLSSTNREELKLNLIDLLNSSTVTERWVLIKLGTGTLRIGVSARFLKQALAEYGNKNIQEIEEVWHAVQPPYEDLFAWLENRSEKPNVMDSIYFHPVMLAHPIQDNELEKISAEHFAAEWKYDGIRVQLVSTHHGKALFSRTGDNISHSFHDLLTEINFHAVLDGELVIKKDTSIGTFNDLQQRLNRKHPSKKLIEDLPAHIIVYDVLALDHEDLRPFSYIDRRSKLEAWHMQNPHPRLSLSPELEYSSQESLQALREKTLQGLHPSIEGLMLKRKTSPYIPGRLKGHWYKWKRDPFVVDAVLMYAQRGHGNRSSFYSDYTFGLWSEYVLLPIGKAYFGFTDEELKQLDKWIRQHTVQKFGPVREVAKELVLEIAFDAVQKSNRHKSGFALRFPRINRIRWDKPAQEADKLTELERLFLLNNS